MDRLVEKLFMAKGSAITKQLSENIKYARFSVKAEKKYRDTWFVDSGATSRMPNSNEFFDEFDPTIKGFVRLGEAKKMSEIKGKGSGAIKCIMDGKQT